MPKTLKWMIWQNFTWQNFMLYSSVNVHSLSMQLASYIWKFYRWAQWHWFRVKIVMTTAWYLIMIFVAITFRHRDKCFSKYVAILIFITYMYKYTSSFCNKNLSKVQVLSKVLISTTTFYCTYYFVQCSCNQYLTKRSSRSVL